MSSTTPESITFAPGLEVPIPPQRLKEGTEIYLAGPLGFAESTRAFHANIAYLIIQMGGAVLDPWEMAPSDQIQEALSLPYGPAQLEAWKRINPIIGKTNVDAIERSSGIVAVLDGVDVDSGTSAEIGMGYVLKKPIIGYRGDFRLSADNVGSTVNLQVEYCITDSGKNERKGALITTIAQLPQQLLRVWGNN